MVVKGKMLIGPNLAIIGGIVMVYASYLVFTSIASIEANLAIAALTWEDTGFSRELMYVRFMCTLLWGLMGIIGAIFAFIGKKYGSEIALLGGILGIAGMLIPLGTITINTLVIPVSLSASFMFFDPIIIIVGSLIGLLLKE